MLCQECRSNEANIHIVKYAGGKQTELNLCEHCARKKDEIDFNFEPQFTLHNLFAGLLEQSSGARRKKAVSASLQCSSCGLTFTQFGQIGRFGCSSCFSAFEEEITPLLKRIHGSSAHMGKVPARIRSRVNILREIDQLKEELQQKIKVEAFEEAAALRDHIRSLEGSIEEPCNDKGEQQ